jgi:hypothetical protein
MSRTHSTLASVVIVALLAIGGHAAASPGRVLVLPLSGEVPGAPEAPSRLTQVVGRAAGLTGADVIIGEATFADAAVMVGCSEEAPSCLSMLADALQVDHVVIGSLAMTPDEASVVVTVKVFRNDEIEERAYHLPGDDLEGMVQTLARDLPGLFLPSSAAEPPPPAPVAKEPAPDEPAPAVTIAEPTPPPSERSGGFDLRRVGPLPWVVTAGGVLLAGSGAGFLWMARDRQREVDRAPLRDLDDFHRVTALEDEGARYATLGNGLLIGGGAAVVVGVVLIALDARAAPARDPALSLTPVPLSGGAGVTLTLRIP